MQAAKPSNRIDTIFQGYSIPLHKKLEEKINVMPNKTIRESYLKMIDLFLNVKRNNIPVYLLHRRISDIITEAIQSLSCQFNQPKKEIDEDHFPRQYDAFIKGMYSMYQDLTSLRI